MKIILRNYVVVTLKNLVIILKNKNIFNYLFY